MSDTASQKYSWKFVAAVPPREVFATVEQLIGTPPYRFEPTDVDRARIVEFERKSLVGGWKAAKRNRLWITVQATEGAFGTDVLVEASKGKAPMMRGLQVVQLLTRGAHDRQTIYRSREIPP